MNSFGIGNGLPTSPFAPQPLMAPKAILGSDRVFRDTQWGNVLASADIHGMIRDTQGQKIGWLHSSTITDLSLNETGRVGVLGQVHRSLSGSR